MNSYPNIIFSLGGQNFELTQDDCFWQESRLCLLHMQAQTSDFWLLGDVFQRKYHTVFDMDMAGVGIALAGSDAEC